jgi:threonyl-tRNA synthetase
MIHRAPFGSMERFVAVLLEHCAGDFPLWLTTDQVAILPLSENYNEYAEKVLKLLENSDIRGFVDDRNEKIGKKIRDSELKKTPFMLIVGDKEASQEQVSVRQRLVGDKGAMSIADFTNLITATIEEELNKNV